MSRIIQIVALTAALGYFVAGEFTAELLGTFPSNTLLWWLNLEVFGLTRLLSSPVSPLRFLFTPAWPLFALSAVLILAVASRPGHRLVLATASNVCFAFAATLVFLALSGHASRSTAALGQVALEWDTAIGFILAAALSAAFLASHVSYWRYFTRLEQPTAA